MTAWIRRLLSVPALVLMSLGPAAEAQWPERQHEIVVPGLGVRLRDHWRLLLHDACRYAVPIMWTPVPDNSEAVGPNGSYILVSTIRNENWELHKSRFKTAFGENSRVRDDAAARLWIESRESVHVDNYVAVFDGTTICAAMFGMPSGSGADDTLRAIAESIGPVGQWTHP